MGISKAGRFSRKRTGGRRKQSKKKRAYERARPASHTKIGSRRVRLVRARGGKYKFRALRLNHGNFVWRSEQATKKTRVTDVVFHPANNEYVRTKTLTKSAIVTIDATPFKVWYKNYYNIDLSQGKAQILKFQQNISKEEREEIEGRRQERVLPKNIEEQFKTGKVLAMISSKPGQVGRADGYILEGEELDFYVKKIAARRKK
mmetsp:Transcript_28488/g.25148  ORF Transcript_28488/g.25148 Transcript_28488/m.25148 type:complete len:203 (-) Transcript_28488:147-755(-)|eukprot:CAMPEP_0201574366 /NCGR_PEP_ID=MMETSP0190_2-20130828/18803_1 /ASSEMBLY_ACC=CAM_ASM_000263 /TAXON_ID=37353 /ORGANISM="Rosalina sp." /LENGTH=202 /DNA_ID=CAMNT_0048002509 /DNA_START=104 /DNA_END=712 /DNA_ORIENTATION=-